MNNLLVSRYLVIAVSILTLLSTSSSTACMSFAKKGTEYPIISDEVALIIWDQKNQVEHFIRQAHFTTDAKDFGFVVPVPTTPELAEAPQDIFGQIYASLYERPVDKGFGGGGEALGSAGRGVVVIKEQRVANMDAVVLSADSSDALMAWLKKHEYHAPREAVEWMDHYIKLKWQFVAFKISPDNNGALSSPIVRISFKTSKIFYPYKESLLQLKGPRRELSLFVVAPFKVIGDYETKGIWKTTHDFSKKLEITNYWKKYFGSGSKKDKYKTINLDYKDGLYVSHFRNQDSPRLFGEDLIFTDVAAKK